MSNYGNANWLDNASEMTFFCVLIQWSWVETSKTADAWEFEWVELIHSLVIHIENEFQFNVHRNTCYASLQWQLRVRKKYWIIYLIITVTNLIVMKLKPIDAYVCSKVWIMCENYASFVHDFRIFTQQRKMTNGEGKRATLKRESKGSRMMLIVFLMVLLWWEHRHLKHHNNNMKINYAWRSRIIFSGFSHHLPAFTLNLIFYPSFFASFSFLFLMPFKHTLHVLIELNFWSYLIALDLFFHKRWTWKGFAKIID